MHEDFPLAYLISFRCYGTWMHGDARGSMDPRHSAFDSPARPVEPRLEEWERHRMADLPYRLDTPSRGAVERAITEVCAVRVWKLIALAARTNHVHVVVAAQSRPEPVMGAFKAYSTRALRRAGLVAKGGRVWSRHGSTRYLWEESEVEDATTYVVHGQ